MEDQLHVDDEFTTSETINNTGSACYAGGIFPGSQQFTVAGGTFTSINKHYNTAPMVPSDFRMIPLGDVDLQHAISAGDVDRNYERARVRKVYSARIDGRMSNMTVAMYQGNGAEEEWQEDIARYMSIRHPNILQIYGAASSCNVHATIFHGDLIPFRHFLDLHRHSPLLTVYIYAYAIKEFGPIQSYICSAGHGFLPDVKCTFWIRRPTGRLCVDLIPDNDCLLGRIGMRMSKPQAITVLDAPNQEVTMVIDHLTLREYHFICLGQLSRSRELYCGSACITVNLGAIVSCSSENRFEDSVEIACLQDAKATMHWSWEARATGEMMEDGWIRYNSDGALDTPLRCDIHLNPATWISQANHIFNRLQITSNFENYVFVKDICFKIILSATTANTPKGFLFLCPETHFQAGPSSFTWPDCLAYWSLDQSGAERLSMDEARRLGFPSLKLTTEIRGLSWDASVYAGLRQLHLAKRFDPDGQGVARHLGHTLYRLVGEVDAPFANVDDEDICAAEEYHDFFNTDEESKNSPAENKEEFLVHDSTTTGGEAEPPSLDDDIQPSSRIFRLVMNVQMALMIFLALSWLYNYVKHENQSR